MKRPFSRFLLFLIFLTFLSFNIQAQTIFGLNAADTLLKLTAASDPNFIQELQATELDFQNAISQFSSTPKSIHWNFKTIPVVVHVIHDNGFENISDAQIQDGIDQINEDFRRKFGTNGYGNGVDVEIQFELAKVDPNGNCTDGINRVQSTRTYHIIRSMWDAVNVQLAGLSRWPNTDYLNLYIVDCIECRVVGSDTLSLYAGYGWRPMSIAGNSSAWNQVDGVVMADEYWGRTGTATGNDRRVSTTACAMWAGLKMLYGLPSGNPCATDCKLEGDNVCDTPPQKKHSSCDLNSNTCTTDNPDRNDLVQNYMSASLGCQNMFTLGQGDRMHGELWYRRNHIYSASNNKATGVGSLGDISVFTNQTWQVDRVINGFITVESGATLEISKASPTDPDVEVFMSPSSLIEVKQGGKLLLNGVHLKSTCKDQLWDGIVVHGNPLKPHPNVADVLNGTYPLQKDDHGVVILANSTIEDAETAIAAKNTGGGIILAENTVFRNNLKAVELRDYSKTNINYFKTCQFETTDFLKGPHHAPSYFAGLYDVRGVTFEGNNFVNQAPNKFSLGDRGMGIVSIDAGYSVISKCYDTPNTQCTPPKPCCNYNTNTFENLFRGIASYNSNSQIIIDETTFRNNWRGVILSGVTGAIITQNIFDVGHSAPNKIQPYGTTSYGLYLEGCDGYIVEENTFTTTHDGDIGSYLWHSGKNANSIYNNNYEFVNTGLATSKNNAGLQIKCNTFEDLGENILLFSGNIAKYQGNCFSPINFSPAGNTFSGSCKNEEHIYANSNVDPFVYYHHPDQIRTPDCYNKSKVTLIACTGGQPYEKETSCPSFLPPSYLSVTDFIEHQMSIVDDIEKRVTQLKKKATTLKTTHPDKQEHEAQMANMLSERAQRINAINLFYQQIGQIDASIHYLAFIVNSSNDPNNLSSIFPLVPLFIQTEQFELAKEMLEKIPQEDVEDVYYTKYYQLQIDMLESGISKDAISGFRTIASSPTRAAILAQNRLKDLLREAYPEVVEDKDKASLNKYLTNDDEPNDRYVSNALSVFPNPADQWVTFQQNPNFHQGISTLTLYNSVGKVVHSQQVFNAPKGLNITVDHLPNGIYFYELILTNGNKKQGKLTIIK